jgi:hypothetical protein
VAQTVSYESMSGWLMNVLTLNTRSVIVIFCLIDIYSSLFLIGAEDLS